MTTATVKHMHTECPCCGTHHTATTPLNGGAGPFPGDVTVCFGCGAICRFDKDMALVLESNAGHPDLAEARRAQRRVRQHLGMPA